mmetsp:Transcript_56502/g.155318  ORF Transcript_56502/g.155318 Transcript_56502/m.155318 type:complete len:226 (-) Transcript_56502:1075-1752(-)
MVVGHPSGHPLDAEPRREGEPDGTDAGERGPEEHVELEPTRREGVALQDGRRHAGHQRAQRGVEKPARVALPHGRHLQLLDEALQVAVARQLREPLLRRRSRVLLVRVGHPRHGEHQVALLVPPPRLERAARPPAPQVQRPVVLLRVVVVFGARALLLHQVLAEPHLGDADDVVGGEQVVVENLQHEAVGVKHKVIEGALEGERLVEGRVEGGLDDARLEALVAQ